MPLSSPESPATAPRNLDTAMELALQQYQQTGRLDHVNEQLRAIVQQRLKQEKLSGEQQLLVEINLFNNLAAWIEYVVQQRQAGKNRVPDFARNLRHEFISQCRQQQLEPAVAVSMAINLATALMDIALTFQRHLGLDEDAEQIV